jgi:hypothetical protein
VMRAAIAYLSGCREDAPVQSAPQCALACASRGHDLRGRSARLARHAESSEAPIVPAPDPGLRALTRARPGERTDSALAALARGCATLPPPPCPSPLRLPRSG